MFYLKGFTGFRGKNIAGVLTTARLKTSRRVVACDFFSQKSILIIIDLRRNCKHENAAPIILMKFISMNP